ncbi:MAG: hypothetical protein AVDCRST_MAG96-1428 [uncultured Segetibacter sp.]|uniref:Uncharacterized protein n=1 Tax=uncultured Segetibacter sp. TaxID=481133 RepID=A0A6J4S908_9BACT|nr:MAG: hypothetical protein AVDCRST_MAG96-1428 [uncultured Segetibacter sp.]
MRILFRFYLFLRSQPKHSNVRRMADSFRYLHCIKQNF